MLVVIEKQSLLLFGIIHLSSLSVVTITKSNIFTTFFFFKTFTVILGNNKIMVQLPHCANDAFIFPHKKMKKREYTECRVCGKIHMD